MRQRRLVCQQLDLRAHWLEHCPRAVAPFFPQHGLASLYNCIPCLCLVQALPVQLSLCHYMKQKQGAHAQQGMQNRNGD